LFTAPNNNRDAETILHFGDGGASNVCVGHWNSRAAMAFQEAISLDRV
jgi:hypothetical protein